jgi:hypothetical protein
MKKGYLLALSALLSLGILSGCSSSGQSSEVASSEETTVAASQDASKENESATEAAKDEAFQSDILFCGSTSLYPIISSLASSFTEEYVTWNKVDPKLPEKNISIYVAPGGSGVGASAAIDKTADFGMLARSVKDEEKEALGADYKDFTVAKDALTVSVNAENPIAEIIDDMSSETIQKIFSGELSKWNEVDSTLPEENINVYIRDLSGGAYEVFQKSIMKETKVTDTATQSASMTELANNVANDKWGIGYVGYGAFNKANKEKTVLIAMKVDGVEANEDDIKNGSYIIQRPVLFLTGDKISESEQLFIDYIFSQKGYDVVVENGYIPAFEVK